MPDFRTVTYKPGLEVDYLVPGDGRPHPAVALFPGGGFESADRTSLHFAAEELVDLGFLAGCFDYTVTGDPADALPDGRDAVRWLKARRHCNGRVVAAGSSAGGFLAFGLAIEAGTGVTPLVRGAAAWSGAVGETPPPIPAHARPLWDGHADHDSVPLEWVEALQAAYLAAGKSFELEVRHSWKHGLKLVGAFPDLKANPPTGQPMGMYDFLMARVGMRANP